MLINEAGVSQRSVRFFFTPSDEARQLFYYPTRIGHYFCDRAYQFSYRSEIAQQAGHHLNFMLFFLKQGQLEITCEGRTMVASRYQAVVFDCRKPHEYHALTDDLEFYWLLFNGGQSEFLVQMLLTRHGGAPVFQTPDAMQLQLSLSRLLSCGEIPHATPEHQLSEQIYSVLCRLLALDAGQNGELDRLIARAVAFIDRNAEEAMTVDSVASHVGLSGSYFTKLFRQQTGYSPYEYLTLRRIQRAKELLLATDLSVKQIAFETGYNSEENFIRNFKKKVGVAPTAFRRLPV